jgi:ABC-2 type transport system ATP-binding protein
VLGFDPRGRPVHLMEEVYVVSEEFSVPPLFPQAYEALYAPFYPRFDHVAFHQSLKEFELGGGKRLSDLSYGQKKKYLLAFGLAAGCRILLLDEPTNGLDIPSKSQFRRLLARSVRDDQLILISTHQVRDMENVIDPIIILDEGRIIFQQPMAEVAKRLSIRVEPQQPQGDGILYSESTLGGWVVVRSNDSGSETRVDLETLFNAVTANTQAFLQVFPARVAEKAEVHNG